MISIYILVLAIATSGRLDTGMGIISTEFISKESCEVAGKSLVEGATKRGSYIVTWGCFKK